jgi:hypothetical protein
MSDHSSQDLDGLDFDERTTKDRFNERLLKAQESNTDDELVDRIVSEHFKCLKTFNSPFFRTFTSFILWMMQTSYKKN